MAYHPPHTYGKGSKRLPPILVPPQRAYATPSSQDIQLPTGPVPTSPRAKADGIDYKYSATILAVRQSPSYSGTRAEPDEAVLLLTSDDPSSPPADQPTNSPLPAPRPCASPNSPTAPATGDSVRATSTPSSTSARPRPRLTLSLLLGLTAPS
ncbi:hypothetical protein K488DRAFT_85682 [Vararia minispora EC-137]|uniref:Uncharacterized protein n=1 Tax=Vararia minispora EC-137 TaxID=1314806 RepID=A0ACB8QLQ3_9AGAM|nr:hypothetical protein K488DRAFT_85682 [Vararia minispora EC-137]